LLGPRLVASSHQQFAAREEARAPSSAHACAPIDRHSHATTGCLALAVLCTAHPSRRGNAMHQHQRDPLVERAVAGAAGQRGCRLGARSLARYALCVLPHLHRCSSQTDARFEVIGTPFSLLSVSLSASQTLYTRRGTLVGLSGKSENTLSTLSVLEPFRRAPVGIPFLYQKVSSTSPVTALVSTKSPISSIVSVNLDGRQDWVISQRQALLAWTGHTLSLKPQYNVKLGLDNWGNTYITGRGLLALAGKGQIYQVQVKAGENYVAHPRYMIRSRVRIPS
jgi:uncharacterized protein (AIM24 family)